MITPALSEQLGLLESTNPNIFSRVLIIEGASHFSPINIVNIEGETKGGDVYQISDSFVGVNPASVQLILAQNIINFLTSLETEIPMPLVNNYKSEVDLKFHILDQETIKKLLDN